MNPTVAAILADQPVVPSLILVCLLVFAFVLLVRAQQRPDFDIAQMLQEDGKVSSTKMFSFIAIAVSSWIIAFLTIAKALTPEYFSYYLIIWSGTAVAIKIVDKWNGTLPFSRSDMANAVQASTQAGVQAGVQAGAQAQAAATGTAVAPPLGALLPPMPYGPATPAPTPEPAPVAPPPDPSGISPLHAARMK